MRSLFATLLLLPATASAVAANGPSLTCPDQVHQAQRGKAVGPNKLGELPPGQLYLTVMRDKGSGCYEPVKVRDGYGAAPFQPPPKRR